MYQSADGGTRVKIQLWRVEFGSFKYGVHEGSRGGSRRRSRWRSRASTPV